MNKRLLILIGGGSGSGKTTLVNLIKKKFKKITVISTDFFYKDFSSIPPNQREKINFDHPDSLDFELMRNTIKSLLSGKEVRIPIYDFKTHTRLRKKRRIVPSKIIVVEGIFALLDKEINKLADLRIFVETDDDIRLIRRILRDMKERGRSLDSIIEQWIKHVKPMHEKFIEPSRKEAHLIIPEDPEGRMREVAVESIIGIIERLIKQS